MTSNTEDICGFPGTLTPSAPAPKLNPPSPAIPPPGATPLPYGPASGDGKPCIAANGDAKTFGPPASDST